LYSLLTKSHHPVIAHDNGAPFVGLLLIVVATRHTTAQGGHQYVNYTFLVDGDLDRDIEPFRFGRFGFGNDAAVLGVGQECLFWYEALEQARHGEIQVPEQSKERQQRQNNFNNDPSNVVSVRINGIEEQEYDHGHGPQKGHPAHVRRHQERFRRSGGRSHPRFAKGRSRNERRVVIEQPLIGGIVEEARHDAIKVRLQIFRRGAIDGGGKVRFRVEKQRPVIIDTVNDVILVSKATSCMFIQLVSQLVSKGQQQQQRNTDTHTESHTDKHIPEIFHPGRQAHRNWNHPYRQCVV
jgi:hypothetical protein